MYKITKEELIEMFGEEEEPKKKPKYKKSRYKKQTYTNLQYIKPKHIFGNPFMDDEVNREKLRNSFPEWCKPRKYENN